MKIYKYFFYGIEIEKNEYEVEKIFKGDVSIIDKNGITYTHRLKILQYFCPPIKILYLPYKLSKSQVYKLRKVLFKCSFK